MLFLLRQRLVLIPSIVATVLWATTLVAMTVANGKDTPETIAILCAISVMCGVGTTVIVVGPAFMLYRHWRTKAPVLPLLPGERVLFVCGAGHFLEGEGRGGRLLVTDQRIAFRPHRYNVQLDVWSVPFSAVSNMRPRLPTFVFVELAEQKLERLVLPRRETMAEYLDMMRSASVADRPARSRDFCGEHHLSTLQD